MNTKSVQKKLASAVGEKLAVYGFDPTPKQQSLRRKFADGCAYFHLAFVNHDDDFDVTADVAIRLDTLEDLVNSHDALLTEREKKNTCSLGVELGNLSIGEQQRWSIKSEDDVETVASAIADTYGAYGEPYLRRYASLEEAYCLLSRDDQLVWKHSPIHASRAKRAVGLAKLLRKPEIDRLIQSKKSFLEDKADFGLKDFLNFVESM